MQSSKTDAPPVSPLSILVVDDDSALIRTLADILRLHGYAPATALTGSEGLERAREHVPALAVVDLRLPDMDGIELAARLHELSDLTDVVVLTGNASVESAVAALREHSVDYLLKPVNVDRLLQVAQLASERWQRRRAEEKLRESNERFRSVVESDMLGIAFWSGEEGDIDDANDAFLRMTGFTRHDLEASRINWHDITPPEYWEEDARALREVVARGSVSRWEKELIRKDRRRLPVLIGTATLPGDQDRGVAFLLDITDRKAAERSLEARARQQEAVAKFGRRALASDGVEELIEEAVKLVADTLDLPFTSVLERKSDGSALVVRASLGWEPNDGAQSGSAAPLSIPMNEETQAGYTLLAGEACVVSDMSQSAFKTAVYRSRGIVSGVTVPIPGVAQAYGVLAAHDRVPREYSDDQVLFLHAMAHLIGTAVQRHKTEAAFRQAQRLEAVGRLAGGVAHDFNNMLTAITGYSEIMKSQLEKSSPFHDDIDEILRAAHRAAGLTRQLLAFSRQQVLQPRPLNLNDVVRGVENMMRRLLGSDIRFETRLEPDLAWTKADPGQVEQVIVNLCVNARDAMPDGGTLTLETSNAQFALEDTREFSISDPGDYVMLSVADTGHGMDGETRARIFEPFFTTKPADKGTGLGLATVYGIVKQSGGDIWVYSEVGHGTIFKVFLPAVHEIAPAEKIETKAVHVGGTETVLLAEDEDAIRALADRVLRRAGYTVLTARNGDEAQAVSAAHGGPIHLLVTDMVMPKMNGRQLAEILRPRRSEMRVLYLSGYTDATAQAQGLVEAGEQFLQKPFTNDLLLRKVRETLDLRRPSAG